MLYPSNVTVTVRQARNLVVKSKDGINKAYVTIEYFKEKFITEVEASTKPKWFTECNFSLAVDAIEDPKALIIICVYNKRHGFRGLEPDSFLGQIQILVSSLNFSDRTERIGWYKLHGRKNIITKDRGEIELSFRFNLSKRPKQENTKGPIVSPKFIKIIEGLKKTSPSIQSIATNSLSTKGSSSSGSQKVPAKENSTSKHVTFNESQATGIPEANVEIDLKKAQQGKRNSLPNTARSELTVQEAINSSKKPLDGEPGTSGAKKVRRSISLFDVLALHLREEPDRSPKQVVSSMKPSTSSTDKQAAPSDKKLFLPHNKLRNYLNFYSSKKKEAIINESSNEEVVLSFTSMTHSQLLDLAEKQNRIIAEKDNQIKEMQDYIDKILVKVMAMNPHILEGSSPLYRY